MNEMSPGPGSGKFSDPDFTADGQVRAEVAPTGLKTLWFNTGTLCNLECRNCYIESSPRNDRLVYLTHKEVVTFLDEIARDDLPTDEIGFTGGEPFMNPDIMQILETCLARGFHVVVLTNAMKPMWRHMDALLGLRARFEEQLLLRVSLDHHCEALHDEERGAGSFEKALRGFRWLAENGFHLHVAGRTCWGESETASRAGYADLFKRIGAAVNAADPAALTLFPEMDLNAEVPEITTACWDILGKSPTGVMCASSRMVVKHKGATAPTVAACTLLPYSAQFDLGSSLAAAHRPVKLNHPHCAKFCVLGGASCSA